MTPHQEKKGNFIKITTKRELKKGEYEEKKREKVVIEMNCPAAFFKESPFLEKGGGTGRKGHEFQKKEISESLRGIFVRQERLVPPTKRAIRP